MKKLFVFVLLLLTSYNFYVWNVVGVFSTVSTPPINVNMPNQNELLNDPTEKEITYEGFDISKTATVNSVQKTLSNENNVHVVIELNYSYPYQLNINDKNITSSEADELLKQYREKVSEYHRSKNISFIKNLDGINFTDLYTSKYAPFIEFQITGQEISDGQLENLYTLFNSNSEIKNMYIQKPMSSSSGTLSNSLLYVDLPYNLNNGYPYNGTGVNIGIIDPSGIVDTDNANFTNSSLITVRNVWYYNESIGDHATLVASVAGGNNGVARGAHIYSVELSGNPTSEVDWLLDNGVNVINNSWYDNPDDGTYTSVSAYFDYIVYTAKVTIVSATGNYAGYVGDTGLGYNVITVGATDDVGNEVSITTYNESISISKPTLMAPGWEISIPNITGTYNGSSISAPIVAGAIAILMQKNPVLKLHPELVASIITAGAHRLSAMSDPDSSGLDDEFGAGMLDYAYSDLATDNGVRFSYSDDKANSFVLTRIIYLYQGDVIQASLSWIVNSNKSTTINFVTNLNLYVYNSSNSLVAYSNSSYNNIEYVHFTVPATGYYYFKAYQVGSKAENSDIIAAFSYTKIF